MVRRLLAALSLLMYALPLQAAAESADYRATAAQRLADLDAPAVPGLAYAVVDGDEVTELGASGVRRLGGHERVTPDTPFPVGSISKSFTALAVLQLAEAGALSLDDPLAAHLPAFAGRPSGDITVRELLSHTSGFSTYQGHFPRSESSSEKDALARRADRLAAAEPAYAPGARWEYSNANYLLLGRLVEVLSGEPFAGYVQAHIFEPVGMRHSFVADGERHPAMATGHRPWFGARRAFGDSRTDLETAPQGGVVASAPDLARYMVVMMNGESDIVSAEAKAAMMEPAGEASPFYGFGWFVDREKGTVGHSGSIPGVETLLTMVPAQRRGVVVLVNAGSGVGFGETAPLRNGITAAALGLPYAGEPSRWGHKATFVSLALLPLGFVLSMLWAWRHRNELRAKSGAFGLFSLWFPLLTTLAAAWVIVVLVPRLVGLPMGTLRLFQPDIALAMFATAGTGVLWAMFRLVLAHTGRSTAASEHHAP